MTEVNPKKAFSIVQTLTDEFRPLGFEFHPFKVGWYNSCVNPVFHLKYDANTLCIVIVSNPSMFDNAFIPYLKTSYSEDNRMADPIDECIVYYLSRIKQVFPYLDVEVIHDFEVHSNRRPKVLMQTAAHVSGAAYFYQRFHLREDNFGSRKIYGVCIHPKYGGWFAMRGIVIFRDLLCPSLPQVEPADVVSSEKQKLQLLEMYNDHWEDWAFRDIIPTTGKYSPLAMKYFSKLPKERFSLIQEIIDETATPFA